MEHRLWETPHALWRTRVIADYPNLSDRTLDENGDSIIESLRIMQFLREYQTGYVAQLRAIREASR